MGTIKQFETFATSKVKTGHASIALKDIWYLKLLFLSTIFLFAISLSYANTIAVELQSKSGIEASSLNDNIPITHESVGEKYSMFKVSYGDTEVIFRHDRIEFFQKTTSGESSSFLIFKDAAKANLSGIDLVEESEKAIPNPAMASVLGQSSMKIRLYQQIQYKNIFPSTDLLISASDEGLDFVLVNANGDVPDLELISIGNQNLAKSTKGAAFSVANNAFHILSEGLVDVSGKSNISIKNNSGQKKSQMTFQLQTR